ncbi:GNAT family N-acetyltransferase [Mesorhizobium sangaii]|uniref:Ribosomal protein S18 acetylase RimI-like enzyme n=1 Tax=Mesorhizobium sangaii TaxID=505389 RepID=A0A841PD06_9HYPH|nr:GNAT family N-acetyltransferase [Mesorhizobium sangaii]MBB6411443.1 ribosomal protein S18 acetylase RimI-like enzyme [Mesorhizobium sangaii]
MDYLVNLSLLSPDPELDARIQGAAVTIRRALAPELELVTRWVRQTFNAGWSSETTVAFSRQPTSCFMATRDGGLVGFAVYDSIARGFFGPTGVDEAARGAGIGHALLLATLLDMRVMGYGYAIIGDVGPSEFYERTVGATQIPDSEPGVYAGLLNTHP